MAKLTCCGVQKTAQHSMHSTASIFKRNTGSPALENEPN